MRTLPLLLALLAFQQKPPDASKISQQPIKDWKYTRKDPNPRTGAEEVSLILEGKEAVPVDLAPGKEIFDIRGIHARYFTDPRSPGEKSREIDVRAQRGRLDNRARTLKLDDQVVVFKKGDPALNEIDTVLRTVSALLTFARKYECPDCRILMNEPGRCVLHDKPLKETSVTNVEADREFEIAGSEGILSGEGLVTDDALRKAYHITKNGFIEFAGAPPSLNGEAKPAAPAELKFTQIFSRGPLQITGDEDHRRIQGRGGTRIDRIDPTGTITTEADEITLATIRTIDPVTKQRRTTEIEDVEARGRVKVEGVVFADGTSFAARADTLSRKHDGVGGKDLITLLPSPSEPVDLKAGASTISARKVVLDRVAGTAHFEDVERSDLVSGAQHFSLSCRTLTTDSGEKTPGSLALKNLKARDHVVLGGLMGASEGPPGRAEADAFDWDAEKSRGLLEGKPTVRVVQGNSLISAPRIVLESPTLMVLKGPKQIHFVQEKDGKREEYRATCDSDLVLDQVSHRLRMQGNCSIRTGEMSLTADRVDGLLSADGRGLESLNARGRVRALRTLDHTTLYGDRLTFRFADQDLRVYGDPVAVADTGRSVATQAEIRVYEKINPKTGKKVRYTEMIGVGDGVRIEVDERPPKPKNGESKPVRTVTLIPGDGTGPELTSAMRRVVDASGAKLNWEVCPAGEEAIEKHGTPLPPATLDSIKRNKVAIKGPLSTPIGSGYRSVNVALRKELDLYAGIRPCKSMEGVPSPFEHVDLVVIRENTEDLYAGVEHWVGKDAAESIRIITREGSTRIAHAAFEYAARNARRKVTIVHKANIQKFTDGLFLDTARSVARDYPQIQVEDRIVDNMAMQLIQRPEEYDILLCPNLYGDILSDLCAGLVGGLGMAPGMNLGREAALFEAVHGSAPQFKGQDKLNPVALILSAVLMLEHLNEHRAAERIQKAVARVVEAGEQVTFDLGGKASTTAMTDAILAALQG